MIWSDDEYVLYGKPVEKDAWRDAFIEFTRKPVALKLDRPTYTDGTVYRYLRFYDSYGDEIKDKTQWANEPTYFYSKHIFAEMGEVSKKFKPGHELCGFNIYTNDAGEITWFNLLTWPVDEAIL